MTQPSSPSRFLVAALYHFCRLDRYESLRGTVLAFCRERGIKGTLLLAREGINGTVAGDEEAVRALVEMLRAQPEFGGIEVKFSHADEMPFHRMKVRLKREIVTMGVEGIDPLASVGAYVEPAEWNALISSPETILIDTRNDYEFRIGTFEGAVDPDIRTFREFPAWVHEHKSELEGRKVAMFCTGGIRCEKATAYVKSLGFDDVFHLKGGILKYLEQVPVEESLWKGECFVFDERVALKHGLEEGEAELCRACREPITPAERLSPKYHVGISCERCFDARSDADRARYAERQRQVESAEAKGLPSHIGS